jgi:predicted dehydrogenase
VTAILDPDEAGVRSRLDEIDKQTVKFYPNIDGVIKSGVDALFIGCRCNLHTPYAIEALGFKVPLFLEKPVAISMEQAIALEHAFERSQCKVVVSFPLRVSPLTGIIRQYIEEQRIGTPEHICATNYVPYGTVYWDSAGYKDFSITQGLFLQKATHDFDYMSFLMGSNIVRIAAMWNRGRIFGGKRPAGLVCSKCPDSAECLESPQNRARNKNYVWLDQDHQCVFNVDCGTPREGMNEDCSSALIEYSSGAHGVYTQVFFSRRDAARRGAIISGYHGTLSFDWYKNEAHYVRHHRQFSDTICVDSKSSHFGGDDELARNFIAVIKGEEQSQSTLWQGIQSVYTCLAAKESADKGTFVKVRQVGTVN